MSGQIGYERPPLVTAADLSGRGHTTLGQTSPAFSMLQAQAKADGQAPVLTSTGPAYLPVGSLGIGIGILLVLGWYLDHRVI